jgi:ATP phosphoribosyltransferase regulatory subunit
MDYYSGIVFRGFIKGLAAGVLSGGQYDKMVEKMGKRCGAIGFAIYLNELDRLRPADDQWDADVLVLYDQKTDLTALTGKLASLAAEGKKALARKEPQSLRVKETIDMRGGEQA